WPPRGWPVDRCSSFSLQLPLQCFAGTRQVRLDRPLAAAHGLRRAGHVELLQHTEGERLALAPRQPRDRLREPRIGFAALVRAGGAGALVGPFRGGAVLTRDRWGKPAQPEAAPPLQVDDAAAQDPPEQWRPLRGGAILVAKHPDHGVLHRIHGVLALAQAEFG